MRSSLVAAAQEYAKASQTVGNEVKLPEKRVEENLGKIQKLGLPIGWNFDDERIVPAKELGAWLLKLLGWLLTAMAISLGAPFWFDLLNKFMTARSTLKPSKPDMGKEAPD